MSDSQKPPVNRNYFRELITQIGYIKHDLEEEKRSPEDLSVEEAVQKNKESPPSRPKQYQHDYFINASATRMDKYAPDKDIFDNPVEGEGEGTALINTVYDQLYRRLGYASEDVAGPMSLLTYRFLLCNPEKLTEEVINGLVTPHLTVGEFMTQKAVGGQHFGHFLKEMLELGDLRLMNKYDSKEVIPYQQSLLTEHEGIVQRSDKEKYFSQVEKVFVEANQSETVTVNNKKVPAIHSNYVIMPSPLMTVQTIGALIIAAVNENKTEHLQKIQPKFMEILDQIEREYAKKPVSLKDEANSLLAFRILNEFNEAAKLPDEIRRQLERVCDNLNKLAHINQETSTVRQDKDDLGPLQLWMSRSDQASALRAGAAKITKNDALKNAQEITMQDDVAVNVGSDKHIEYRYGKNSQFIKQVVVAVPSSVMSTRNAGRVARYFDSIAKKLDRKLIKSVNEDINSTLKVLEEKGDLFENQASVKAFMRCCYYCNENDMQQLKDYFLKNYHRLNKEHFVFNDPSGKQPTHFEKKTNVAKGLERLLRKIAKHDYRKNPVDIEVKKSFLESLDHLKTIGAIQCNTKNQEKEYNLGGGVRFTIDNRLELQTESVNSGKTSENRLTSNAGHTLFSPPIDTQEEALSFVHKSTHVVTQVNLTSLTSVDDLLRQHFPQFFNDSNKPISSVNVSQGQTMNSIPENVKVTIQKDNSPALGEVVSALYRTTDERLVMEIKSKFDEAALSTKQLDGLPNEALSQWAIETMQRFQGENKTNQAIMITGSGPKVEALVLAAKHLNLTLDSRIGVNVADDLVEKFNNAHQPKPSSVMKLP